MSTQHLKYSHVHTPEHYRTGYGCSQCGRALGKMCWEGDSGVYCRQRCADAHVEGLDEMKREDEMRQQKQAHGGARSNAGPKTHASKGLATKSARVTVRFTEIEFAVLQREADAEECSVAELVGSRALAYTISLHERDE